MEEREAKRIEYAYEDIVSMAALSRIVKTPEQKREQLVAMQIRVARALCPRSDEQTLRAWDGGALSEEGAYKSLGVTRLEARAMLNDWRDKQSAAAEPCAEGHEYAEVAPYRTRCVRCGKVKEWQDEAEAG